MTEYADTVAAHLFGEDLDRACSNLDFNILCVQRGRPAELWRPRDDRSGFDREDITWPIAF